MPNFKLAATLSFLRLPGAETKFDFNSNLRTLGEEAGKCFSTLSKYYAVNEIGNIFPLTGLLVPATIVNRNAEG